MNIGMALAGKAERLLSHPVLSMDTLPLCQEDLDELVRYGSVHAIALSSGWALCQKTQVCDDYKGGFGRGTREYITATTIEIPTECGVPFIVTFDMSFKLYFAEREARSRETGWHFNGVPFPFLRRLVDEPTVWDYMFSVGCPLNYVERRISSTDEAALRHARTEWLKKFQPARLTEAERA
jgi:hypothetical protein